MFVRYASTSTGGLEHVGTQESHGILRHPTASYGTDFPMSTLYMSTCFLNGGKILNQVCGLL